MKEKYEIQLFPSASWNLFVSRKKPSSVTHKFVCLFVCQENEEKGDFPITMSHVFCGMHGMGRQFFSIY